MSVTHLVFDGVADGPLGVALDVVATAARLVRAGLVSSPVGARALRQRVVSIDGGSVRTGAGRVLAVDGRLSLRALGVGDALVIAGLGAASEGQVATLLGRSDITRGCELLGRVAERGVTLAASCSATFVLGAAGVLDGRRATTTGWLVSAFAARFPRVRLAAHAMVVEDDGVFTAGAALAHADLMMALLSRTVSPALAHLVARYLLLDERVSQARYMLSAHLASADPIVARLEAFVLANLDRSLGVEVLAAATATSPRTLARKLQATLGTTPHAFVQRLRVARAAELLETCGDGVEAIAAAVGYADPAAFRRAFRKLTGQSPRALRAASRESAGRERTDGDAIPLTGTGARGSAPAPTARRSRSSGSAPSTPNNRVAPPSHRRTGSEP